jgi:hypothetical protein
MMTRLSHQTDQKGKRNKAKAKEVKDGIDAALKEGIRSRGGEGSKNWRAKEGGCDHHTHRRTFIKHRAPLGFGNQDSSPRLAFEQTRATNQR